MNYLLFGGPFAAEHTGDKADHSANGYAKSIAELRRVLGGLYYEREKDCGKDLADF